MLIAALIVTLGILFFPHGNPLSANIDQTEELLKKNVHDEARLKEALQIMDQAAKDVKTRQEEQKKVVEPLTKVLNKRESTPAEIDAALRPVEKVAAAVTQKQLDWRFQLKAVLTEREWTQVFPPPAATADKQGTTKAM